MKKTKQPKSLFQWALTLYQHNQFVEKEKASSLNSRLALQLIIAISFLLLSIANMIAQSYHMLLLTAFGFVTNAVFVTIAWKKKSSKVSAVSSLITCSLLFASFVICGGNDGFACLWVILLPLLSMVIMDFKYGFWASLFFQIFLIVVFWTPLSEQLLYDYNDQFCLRFPLFFFVTFMLGFSLTTSLKQAEYKEHIHLIELEELHQKSLLLSRIDPLTKLANRRYTYEELDSRFAVKDAPHCIVMGDIDDFKRINDLYGHEFGDEVLTIIAKQITDILPGDYLKSRWGGEEFLFAANASPDTVCEQVEKLRRSIAEYPFSFNAISFHITMTFGIAPCSGKEGISEAIHIADQRLYIGKSKNKNRTVMRDS